MSSTLDRVFNEILVIKGSKSFIRYYKLSLKNSLRNMNKNSRIEWLEKKMQKLNLRHIQQMIKLLQVKKIFTIITMHSAPPKIRSALNDQHRCCFQSPWKVCLE